MLSKFFPHGKGEGSAPIDYLLGKNRDRQNAEILRGNAELTKHLIDSAKGKHKYTSGVLSFGEKISDEKKQLAMNSYERFLTADESVELNFLWVEHKEHNRTELHFVVPNTDLNTNRVYTPYVDRVDFGVRTALDEYLNAQIGGADPNDPARKRLSASASDYLKQSNDRKELIQSIDEHILNLVEKAISEDKAWTQEDTVKALQDLGFKIERQTKKAISISHPDLKKNIRLKGGLYESTTKLTKESFAEIERDSDSHRRGAEQRAETAFKLFEERLSKRRERVSERYSTTQREPESSIKENREQQRRTERDIKRDNRNSDKQTENNNDSIYGNADNSVFVNNSDDLWHNKVLYQARAVESGVSTTRSVKEQRNVGKTEQRHICSDATSFKVLDERPAEKESLSNPLAIIEVEFKGRKLGEIYDYGDMLVAHNLSDKAAAFNLVKEGIAKGWKKMGFGGSDDFLRHAMRMALDKGVEVSVKDKHQAEILKQVIKEKEEHDRVRENVDRTVKEAERASSDLIKASSELIKASSELNQRIRRVKREDLKAMYDDELNKFKTEINLAEYLQSHGFVLDSKKSTNKTAVLKQGDDTLLVSRNENGHYLYFDVNSGKGGTIIDFIQSTKSLSLGQVRKELRACTSPTTPTPFFSQSPQSSAKHLEKSSKTEQEQAIVNERFKALKPLNPSYLNSRGITQIDERFSNVRTDERNNTCFPHYSGGRVCGWEVKNNDFTAFSKGGTRNLYVTTNFKTAKEVVIVESGIDALSHAQLFNTDNSTAYISIGGQLTERQLNVLAKNLSDKEVTIATDNDLAGFEFANKIKLSIHHAKRETPNLKDWNDDLRAEQQAQQEQLERAATRSGFDLSM